MKAEFPFPDRVGSREELVRDIHYHKIPQEDISRIADRAWNTGVTAAEGILDKYPGRSIWEVIKQEGLHVIKVDEDNVIGGMRCFSEYYSGRKTITLYLKSVKMWAAENKLSLKYGEELILAHEFYHHLECSSMGLTSDQYMVPRLTVGRRRMGKSGIRALSEIGAHGFARTFYAAGRH
ncbi:hypothetical protein [Clostridium sp. C105KSO13]|uniref:hypothetical protein n=1 Tax=Clostridium sp. C105KSO13 TaxID=1776045 RepID=UPI0007407A8E|nr:hypothetical protein [Clostridium sp. C105KSO13]CUX26744.1 hypothetical protein BN3456_00934 [Clostridium sp. C105KSO13]